MMQITGRKFRLEEQTEQEDFYYARYSLAPLDKGYAVTIGNTLRRVLLSSIPSFAITDVRFIRPEKYHEFDTIDGVKEDILEILLNLKKVQLRVEAYVESPVKLLIRKKGPCTLTAGDIECPAGVIVANPKHYIATLNEDADIEVELYATFGKGFVPASERNERPEIGWIVLDGVYSPVIKVNWLVENVRVDKRTDFEKLILEIWTKKSIKPAEALKHSLKIIIDHFSFIEQSLTDVEELPIPAIQETVQFTEEFGSVDDYMSRKIEELDLSARSLNCLKRDKIETIGDLLSRTEEDLMKIKNFGQKSLEEVKEKLKEKFGLTLRKGEK
ncbi:DNA-directed RNA polymerase subunit alpha [Fervidobacterium thailandense]|uniref:DNA-directed RNA polymerase subunit alpha n=1 Tax=Fervidobacterium thailandense TaxID=1008305 RepID=A0A1E3G233_9BACT|nr:DNA-directed RNA polymerase subunit alpha [Fervidobacterium thailandense]ODN30344.1 DNA-directed RNA polymerase subunit alpha [Fervidobacterium thailandense]